MVDIDVRPLAADDIPAAQETAYNALRDAGKRYGWEMPELDDDVRTRGLGRLRHGLEHDPAGSWVADRAGDIVGIGVATRRGPLWFLSLLAVATSVQSQGIGRRLLDATMLTLDGPGVLCASSDPKALRRYRKAGFDVHPAYEATGTLDRSAVPALGGIRPGSYDDDRDFVEHIATLQRGTPHGPDLDHFAAVGSVLYVTDSPAGQGYAIGRKTGPELVAATTPAAASGLLWTTLAEAQDEKLEVLWMTHDQQWAVDVVLDARLSVRPGVSRCQRGAVGPMSPYLPSGAWG